MAEDWAADVRKYAPDANEAVIAGIVRHCGIALRTRDASLVSFIDPAETNRVRDGFCRKTLGVADPDPVVDAAIARVGERMHGDPTKNRVTVYYLLAEAFGKLGLFGAAVTAADAAAPGMASPVPLARPAPAFATPPSSFTAAAAAPLMGTMKSPAGRGDRRDRATGGGAGTTALAGCGVLALIVVVTATIGSLVGYRVERDPLAVAATVTTPTPAAAAVAAQGPAPAIPSGAGVIAQATAGKPMVSVYFDTAKTDVTPDFAAAAAPLKTYLDGHPGARLAVSGFNDPRGNAAFNAQLSKDRAKAVAAALTAAGVPGGGVDLVKPADTTDTQTSLTQARRVDIVVRDPV